MKKILVTGADGFIGSHLTEELVREGYDVKAFVLGNSSSGISEAPVLGTPTVNIGSRQEGRLMARTIVNCRPEMEDILRAMDCAAAMEHVATDMYGDGNTSAAMLSILKRMRGQTAAKKKFYDISFDVGKWGIKA